MLLNVMNKINHQILCILFYYINIIFFMWTADTDLYLKSSNLVSFSKSSG